MYEFTSLVAYKPLFVLELMIAVLLYSWHLKRKIRFVPRFLFGTVLILAAGILYPVTGYTAVTLSVMFLFFFLMEILFLLLCYQEPPANIFFCAIAGFTTQHLASAVYNLMLILTDLQNRTLFGYGSTVGETDGFTFWTGVSLILYIDLYILVYWLLFLGFGSRMEQDEDLRLNGTTTVALAGLIVVADIVINAAAVEHSYAVTDNVYMAVNYAYSILSCLLILFLLFSLISGKKLRQENEAMHQLWAEQRRQYTIAKDNIDRINIKCHDLKHQIRRIAGGSSMSQEEVQEIEQAISIYDAAVKTGNEALDTILTEKSLQCNANGIRITCMADGAGLDFMQDADIYTLFGNAVDNAIEAVMKLRDIERRVIGLKVKKSGAFVSVHIYNYYTGSLQMKGALPETTKEEKEDHGFGLRSMRQITEKYGGSLEIEPEGDVFNLNLLFPVG